METKHKKKARYFLDHLLQGGMKMGQQRGINTYTAFMSVKSNELRDGESNFHALSKAVTLL